MAPPSSSSDRRGGPRSGGGTGRGQGAAGGGRGSGGGSKRGGAGRGGAKQGGAKQGGKGQRGGQKPGGRGAGATGENDTVQQLTGPLQKVLGRLPETQRRVLELRMGLVDGHPHDLADTARALGLSMSETREIEQRAFAHIREVVPLQQLQRFLPKS